MNSVDNNSTDEIHKFALCICFNLEINLNQAEFAYLRILSLSEKSK